MFSSNQILGVSGCLDSNDIEKCLEFALNYSGHANKMEKQEYERGARLLYQITEDGKYCIGWGFKTAPKGWNEYPFRFDVDIVGKIIKQHLKSYDIEKDIFDGSYIKGFIMHAIDDETSSEYTGITKTHFMALYILYPILVSLLNNYCFTSVLKIGMLVFYG